MGEQSWVGKTIGGRYQIEALLGQGGMSAVYRAFDPNLRRTVAIKLIHPHLSTDPNFIGRFKEEAAAVARLRHPNIVQVHDFNTDGETYYMVMDYLVGETLQARLKRLNSTGRFMSFAEASRITTQISDAAGFAHNHELIHRDIKPANIMLDVNNQATLMDFGIVKIIGGEYHTVTGATIGTAMYMSPEQIRGERIDDRSDIYSLGVTLFEMLSGRTPYQADSAMTLMMMVLNDPLPDLRRYRADVPDEFISIIQRALHKDKFQRYSTMADLASALQAVQRKFESGAPSLQTTDSVPLEKTQVEQATPAEKIPDGRMMATVRDEAAPLNLSGATVPEKEIQPSAGVETTPTPDQELPAEPDPLDASSMQPKKKLGRLYKRYVIPVIAVVLLIAAIILGYQYYRSNLPPSTQLSSINYAPVPVNADTINSIVSLGTWDIDSYVFAIEFSPDGISLATADNRDWLRSSKYKYYASLWLIDPPSLKTYLLGQQEWISDVAFSPDGSLIASASEDATIYLWQGESGSLVRQINAEAAGMTGGITGVDFSPNNKLLAASSWDGFVGLFEVSSGNLLRTLPKQEFGFKDVEFSPDGSLLATGADNGSILMWDVNELNLAYTLTGHTGAIYRLAFSPDGRLLASSSEDHLVKLWNLGNGTIIDLLGHSETVKDVAFSVDGSLLASGSEDGTLRFWQVSDGQLLHMIEEYETILSVAFSPDGFYLATGESNGVIHFWGMSEVLPVDISPP